MVRGRVSRDDREDGDTKQGSDRQQKEKVGETTVETSTYRRAARDGNKR